MNKKKVLALLSVVLIFVSIFSVIGVKEIKQNSWENKNYDLSVPVLGQDGWYMVFEDDFNGNSLNENITFGDKYDGSKEIWTTSPHAIRWESDKKSKPEYACWWCPEMVEVKNSNAVIHSRYEENHTCNGKCPKQGRFTGGIETRILETNGDSKTDNLLFSQAYGYFECRAKLPNSKGLWSAFWLQASTVGQVGNNGMDGTEIDVFESSFVNCKKSKMGHALHWDGYGKEHKSSSFVTPLEQNLYDGYHTYALKWTPEYYVFYIDGVPTWATKDGDVSRVKEFLRLTVEIDAGDGWGPHGQRIGKFSSDNKDNMDFLIDYVKVWQNENYEKIIQSETEFTTQNN